jgi:hypothetical protein
MVAPADVYCARSLLTRQSMDTADLLQTIAEIGIAFAGFSGLIVSFRKQPGPLTPVNKFRLRILLALAFGALFLSFLPGALRAFGAAEAVVWTASCAAFVLYALVFNLWWTANVVRTSREAPEIFDWFAYARMVAGHAVLVGVQVFVLVSGRIDLGPAAFLVGLIWLLLHAVQQFCRILFVRIASEV